MELNDGIEQNNRFCLFNNTVEFYDIPPERGENWVPGC
jgi:hypothetical protein